MALPADARVRREDADEERGAPDGGDAHGHRHAQHLALDEAAHEQVAEETEDDAGGAQRQGVRRGYQPGAEAVAQHDQAAHREEAADPGQGRYEAEDQQRHAVGGDVVEAEVEEGRGDDAGQATRVAGDDPVLVEGVAGGVVDGLQGPQQGHPAQHQLGRRLGPVGLGPARFHRRAHLRPLVASRRGNVPTPY